MYFYIAVRDRFLKVSLRIHSICVCVLSGLMLNDLVCVLQGVVFAPEKLPLQYLGLFGTFCRYLVDNYAGVLFKM